MENGIERDKKNGRTESRGTKRDLDSDRKRKPNEVNKINQNNRGDKMIKTMHNERKEVKGGNVNWRERKLVNQKSEKKTKKKGR